MSKRASSDVRVGRRKSEANRQKRGFDFSIIEGFDWAAALVEKDERYDYGEERFRAFGRMDDGAAYCVAFTFRDPNIRIISMRRMHEKEAIRYGI